MSGLFTGSKGATELANFIVNGVVLICLLVPVAAGQACCLSRDEKGCCQAGVVPPLRSRRTCCFACQRRSLCYIRPHPASRWHYVGRTQQLALQRQVRIATSCDYSSANVPPIMDSHFEPSQAGCKRSDLCAEQVFGLARLAIDPPYTSPRERHPLTTLLEILKPRWLRNFMFTPSPIHVSHFLNPTPAVTTLTCLVQTTSVVPTTVTPTLSSLVGNTSFFSGHIFFSPLFISDHVVLGVGVLDAMESSDVAWRIKEAPGLPFRRNMRFMRDSESRTLIISYDDPGIDCCIIMTSRLETSTRFNTHTCLIRRSYLHNIALGPDGIWRQENLAPLLMMNQSVYHYRPCVVCGSPASARCNCKVPSAMAAHPFDIDFITSQLCQHVTVSEGVLKKVSRIPGQTGIEILGSRMSMTGVVDPLLIQRLKAWSMSEHVTSLNPNPLESVILLDQQEELAQEGYQRDRGSLISVEGNKRVGASDVLTSRNYTQIPVSSRTRWEPTRAPASVVTSSGPQSAASVRELQAKRGRGTDTNGLGNGSGLADELDDAWWNSATVPEVPSDLPQEILLSDVLLEAAGQAGKPPDARDGANNLGTSQGTSDGATAAGQCSGVGPAVDAEALAKEQKAELRREKNRAAARRSNRKFRAMRDVIRTQIEAELDKIPALREREVQLRTENMKLRRVLKDEGENAGQQ